MTNKERLNDVLWLIERVETLETRIKKLTTALEQIKPGYGIEINDSDEYIADYFAKRCRYFQELARKALEDAS